MRSAPKILIRVSLLMILIPIIAWAASTTIISAGNWNDPVIWNTGIIGNDITKTVTMNNNIGEIIIQNGDSYTTSNVVMNNGNTLTIQTGGSLTIGSQTESHSLFTSNVSVLNIDGNLEIWGNLDVSNTLTMAVSGTMLIHGDVILKNNANIDIQGDVTIDGNVVANDNTIVNVDGSLTIRGTISVGIDSSLTGSGTVNVSGGCTGPDGFCLSALIDSTPPVIENCPGEISISLSGSVCQEVVTWTAPTATDDVLLAELTSNHNSGDIFSPGTTTVTYVATDASGNSSACSFNVVISDDTPPVISNCVSDIAVSGCDQSISWDPPVTSDNCSLASFTSTHTPGDNFSIGITTVTYTATDDAGNTATCSFNVTITDDTPPVISNCVSDITVNIGDTGCETAVSWNPPLATDNCGLASFTSTHAPGDIFGIGTTSVTYTALDDSGNTSTCSFNIIVEDTSPPVFESCPFAPTISEFNPYTQSAIVTWPEPVATDNCGVASITSNKSSGDSFPPGTSTIETTATDNAGNTTTCTVDIVIIGNLVPTGSSHVAISAYSGETTQICLDVTDPDGDDLTINDIILSNTNGTVDYSGNLNDLCLSYLSSDDFEGTDIFYVQVCDGNIAEACLEIEVKVDVALNTNLTYSKALTPNGDGINDSWYIENIDNFPNNHVMVFDRWGGKVFDAKGYNNENIVWDGRSQQSGTNTAPAGTYFYKIDLGNGKPVQQGYIELVIQK